MCFEKLRTLMKAFIDSKFDYCPLIWMFDSKIINSKIYRIHERALRLVYSDRVSSFDELLKKIDYFLFTTGIFTLRENVRIRSHSGLHFPTFGLNTERYGVSLRSQSKCRKMRTRITEYGHFLRCA